MNRRRFLATLCALVAAPALPRQRVAKGVRIQQSPVAGFQYHEGEAVWGQLRAGQALRLWREPNNRYDKRAVRVEWNGHKLGYLPRVENAAVSQMMDSGQPLVARIARLGESRNPWERVVVEVVLRV